MQISSGSETLIFDHLKNSQIYILHSIYCIISYIGKAEGEITSGRIRVIYKNNWQITDISFGSDSGL